MCDGSELILSYHFDALLLGTRRCFCVHGRRSYEPWRCSPCEKGQ